MENKEEKEREEQRKNERREMKEERTKEEKAKHSKKTWSYLCTYKANGLKLGPGDLELGAYTNLPGE